MGRPIKKKWFRARDRGTNADLTVTTQSGDEPIIRQRGTGKYAVASNVVKLTDGAPGAADECRLQHEGKNVRKITQYKVYYFDGSLPAVWRDKDSNIVGTFIPAMTAEGLLALASATVADGAITGYAVDFNGAGYTGVPAVTVSAPDGTSATLTGFVGITGGAPQPPDADQSAMITNGGSGYAVAPVVTQDTGTGTGSVFTAVLTNGIVTSITATAGNSDYVGDETLSIAAVVLTQETATASLTADEVTSIATNAAGVGYVAATVTVAAP